MVKITDILKMKYYLPYKRVLLVLTLLIVFFGLSIYYYSNLSKNYKVDKNLKDIPNSNRRDKSIDILFFHTDWCPHCIKALPAWHSFVESYDNKVVNDYKINCIGGRGGIDCSNNEDAKSNEIRKKYNVSSFPSVKLNKEGSIIHFDAKVTEDNLGKFVKSAV